MSNQNGIPIQFKIYFSYDFVGNGKKRNFIENIKNGSHRIASGAHAINGILKKMSNSELIESSRSWELFDRLVDKNIKPLLYTMQCMWR